MPEEGFAEKKEIMPQGVESFVQSRFQFTRVAKTSYTELPHMHVYPLCPVFFFFVLFSQWCFEELMWSFICQFIFFPDDSMCCCI